MEFLVGSPGIEPDSEVFQAPATTTLAHSPLVAEVGIEPTTRRFSVSRSTNELQGHTHDYDPLLAGASKSWCVDVGSVVHNVFLS